MNEIFLLIFCLHLHPRRLDLLCHLQSSFMTNVPQEVSVYYCTDSGMNIQFLEDKLVCAVHGIHNILLYANISKMLVLLASAFLSVYFSEAYVVTGQINVNSRRSFVALLISVSFHIFFSSAVADLAINIRSFFFISTIIICYWQWLVALFNYLVCCYACDFCLITPSSINCQNSCFFHIYCQAVLLAKVIEFLHFNTELEKISFTQRINVLHCHLPLNNVEYCYFSSQLF